MKSFFKYFIVLASIIGLSLNSCKKQDDFLNVKQSIGQVEPTTLKDFQAIIDNDYVLNTGLLSGANAGSDNIVLSDANLTVQSPITRNIYLWQKDIYQGANSSDWQAGYEVVEYSNIVLDGLSHMNMPSDPTSLTQYNSVKGSALFFRTFAFYGLSGMFCKPYISKTASEDLGIVLRLTSDVTHKVTRSTVQQTYDQMINDLKIAIPLLPVSTTVGYQTRPTRPAAYALLAKIYLAMSDYKDARDAATNSLSEFNVLLDYNSSSVVPGGGLGTFPAYPNNPEICLLGFGGGGTDVLSLTWPGQQQASIDPALYNSYDNNDLRKTCFYNIGSDGKPYYFGDYTGYSYIPFSGIATNEVLLIQAECDVRLNNLNEALSDLNSLLVKRYKTGYYVPLTINDPTTLLNKILLERRKELPFLGQLRWEDLRRLNQDPTYQKTLTRTYQGQTYTLQPNDSRYVLPIPDPEIQLTGIQQNAR